MSFKWWQAGLLAGLLPAVAGFAGSGPLTLSKSEALAAAASTQTHLEILIVMDEWANIDPLQQLVGKTVNEAVAKLGAVDWQVTGVAAQPGMGCAFTGTLTSTDWANMPKTGQDAAMGTLLSGATSAPADCSQASWQNSSSKVGVLVFSELTFEDLSKADTTPDFMFDLSALALDAALDYEIFTVNAEALTAPTAGSGDLGLALLNFANANP